MALFFAANLAACLMRSAARVAATGPAAVTNTGKWRPRARACSGNICRGDSNGYS
jgi:hypothetical protein